MKVFSPLFCPSLFAENDEEISFVWIGDDDLAVCINPNSGRVYATLWHDGHYGYYPIIYVSVLSAIRMFVQRERFGLRLRSFPGGAFEVVPPSGITEGNDIPYVFAFTVNNLSSLQPSHDYSWRLFLNDEEEVSAKRTFTVTLRPQTFMPLPP